MRCKDNVSGDTGTVERLPHTSWCCVLTGRVASTGQWVMLWVPMAWRGKKAGDRGTACDGPEESDVSWRKEG